MVVKSKDAPLDSMVVFADDSSADDLLVPVLKEVIPVPSPAPILDVPPGLVGGQDPPTPAPSSDIPSSVGVSWLRALLGRLLVFQNPLSFIVLFLLGIGLVR